MTYLDVWRSGTFLLYSCKESKKCRQDCLMSSAQLFYGLCLQSVALYSCTEGMCHSSTCPGTSYHVTQFYQAFPRVSTASEKHWCEKARVRGYMRNTNFNYIRVCMSATSTTRGCSEDSTLMINGQNMQLHWWLVVADPCVCVCVCV